MADVGGWCAVKVPEPTATTGCQVGTAITVGRPAMHSWARSTPYPRQEPETQLDDSEMIYSQHPSTGQPSGCQYSSEVRTNQRTPDTTDTS